MPLFVQTAMVKDMDAGTIQNMGVKLKPEDVAAAIFKAATLKDHVFTATHHPVGFEAGLMYHLSRLSPQSLNRVSNLFLSKKK